MISTPQSREAAKVDTLRRAGEHLRTEGRKGMSTTFAALLASHLELIADEVHFRARVDELILQSAFAVACSVLSEADR